MICYGLEWDVQGIDPIHYAQAPNFLIFPDYLQVALLFTGLDIVSAFTAVVACINNTGPGLGEVGPAGNFQGLSDFQTWVCTITMLLGRLELFAVLVLFTPAFWRK